MRRVRYCVAMSLDGYIAGPNGEADWIVMDPEIAAGFAGFYQQFDTLLIGGRTFAAMAGHGRGGGGPFAGYAVLVCSRTLDPAAHPQVTIVADPAVTLAALRAAPGKDIWLFGGGGLFASLLGLGLVDTVEVAVIPVLLGAGIRLLPSPAARAGLTLTRHRIYPATGTVSLEYAVARPAARGAGGARRDRARRAKPVTNL